MKILLLADSQGNQIKLYKTVSDDLTLKIIDGLDGKSTTFIFEAEDIEALICELARLRNLPF